MALPELDGFSFHRVIGRGGSATVYLALQAPFDRQVAVKVYQGQITDDQAQRVFEKECKAIGKLSSQQGIAAFHSAGLLSDGAPYLVMQYYPKGSLAGRVRASGPLEVDEVVGIARRIGTALAATHAAGVIHRDVKPENMLIDDADQAVLADFGISAIGGVTSSRSVMGFSPSHVAPEVLNGAQAGESADLYSFASSLYVLLEGRSPFDGAEDGHPGAMLVRVLQQDAPPLTRSDVPPALGALILRSLAKTPEDRPADMTTFLEELEVAVRADAITVPEALSDPVDYEVDDATVLRSSLVDAREVDSLEMGTEVRSRGEVAAVLAATDATGGDPDEPSLQDATVLRSAASAAVVTEPVAEQEPETSESEVSDNDEDPTYVDVEGVEWWWDGSSWNCWVAETWVPVPGIDPIGLVDADQWEVSQGSDTAGPELSSPAGTGREMQRFAGGSPYSFCPGCKHGNYGPDAEHSCGVW